MIFENEQNEQEQECVDKQGRFRIHLYERRERRKELMETVFVHVQSRITEDEGMKVHGNGAFIRSEISTSLFQTREDAEQLREIVGGLIVETTVDKLKDMFHSKVKPLVAWENLGKYLKAAEESESDGYEFIHVIVSPKLNPTELTPGTERWVQALEEVGLTPEF